MKSCFFPPRHCRLRVLLGGLRFRLPVGILLLALLWAAIPVLTFGETGGAQASWPTDGGFLFASDIESSPSRTSRPYAPSRAADLPGAAFSLPDSEPEPGGLTGAWRSIRNWGITRRVVKVGAWVVGGLRVAWAIPKAIVKGDSRSLIEAIGDLLQRASTETQPERRQEMVPMALPPAGEVFELGGPDSTLDPGLAR
jgi:hypothetical protein